MIVTDEEVKKALEWLTHNADKGAEARANRIHLEEFTKHLKADLMGNSRQETVSGREQEALADERYQLHLSGLKQAIKEDELMRWRKSAADMKIEVWRTEQANARSLGSHFEKTVPE